MAVDPTISKELALLFIELSGQRPTPSNMPRTIKVIKELLDFGYEVDEVAYAIKHAFRISKNVYSIGYVTSIIDSAIQHKLKAELALNKQEIVQKAITKESEVEHKDDIAERNKQKSNAFGVQSRVRTKSYFDLFEGE